GHSPALDDMVAQLCALVPELEPLRQAAPPATFRLAGQRVARETHRFSGRTAIDAALEVRAQTSRRSRCPAQFHHGRLRRPAAGRAYPLLLVAWMEFAPGPAPLSAAHQRPAARWRCRRAAVGTGRRCPGPARRLRTGAVRAPAGAVAHRTALSLVWLRGAEPAGTRRRQSGAGCLRGLESRGRRTR